MNIKKYIIISVILVVLIAILQTITPKPVDWRPSYSKYHKIPFGSYVLNETIDSLFSDVVYNKESFYQYSKNISSEIEHNMIIITDAFSPQSTDYNKILEYVSDGNNIFLAATNISQKIVDTLGLEFNSDLSISDSVINFVNKKIAADSGFIIQKKFLRRYITIKDTVSNTVLGTFMDGRINFVKSKFGNGTVYMNTIPEMFTNYAILKSDSAYAYKALSYLPDVKTIWDEYYKPLKFMSTSPLRAILTMHSLKNAYYVLIFTLLLFIIFNMKRVQRVIPIVEPPKNDSLVFIKTISRLYMHNNDNRDLVEKKLRYFMDYVAERYYIRTPEADNEFFNKLKTKSGIDEFIIDNIRNEYAQIKQINQVSFTRVRVFTSLIDKFYQLAKGE